MLSICGSLSYKLRRAPGSEGFCAAWSAAIETASKKLIDTAFERAIVGSDEPVFNREGDVVGRRHRQSDKLLMFLLRAYMLNRFRHAALSTRHAAEPAPPSLEHVATALERLGPPQPDAPHRLMSAATFDNALQCADLISGKLPHWMPDAGPERKRKDRTNPMPLGEDFERKLEDAKREITDKPLLDDKQWAAFKKARGWGDLS